jgi:hypothetical protein
MFCDEDRAVCSDDYGELVDKNEETLCFFKVFLTSYSWQEQVQLPDFIFRLRSYNTQCTVSHSELRSQQVFGLLSTGVGDQLGTGWWRNLLIFLRDLRIDFNDRWKSFCLRLWFDFLTVDLDYFYGRFVVDMMVGHDGLIVRRYVLRMVTKD